MVVKEIESREQLDKIVKGNGLVFVDFYASWCGPCMKIAPEIERLSDIYSHVLFYKVDVGELDDVGTTYSIRAMPTFTLFKDGREMKRIIGGGVTALKKVQEALDDEPDK